MVPRATFQHLCRGQETSTQASQAIGEAEIRHMWRIGIA